MLFQKISTILGERMTIGDNTNIAEGMHENSIKKVKKTADYVRYLALECIEKAQSGHPGLPLGCADLGVILYRYILKSDPSNPTWSNRDRFILSAGHGSMLLYSLLYMSGYAHMTLEELNQFRQWGSKTPGHPEYEREMGIETTTGPLGQGFANAVGCAIEGKILANRFNCEGFDLFDYTIYTLMGDGCNMEGISYEAGSLAGHLGLDNLVAVYDSNSISIDGRMDITFTEDVAQRYRAMGWDVEKTDIDDITGVYSRLCQFKKTRNGKPKLLIVTTIIGSGLDKKKDTPDIHGSPAGIREMMYFILNSSIGDIFEKEYGKEATADSTRLTNILEKRIKNREPLLDDTDSVNFMRENREELNRLYNEWTGKLEQYKTAHPDKYKLLSAYVDFKIPYSLENKLLNFKETDEKSIPDATRNISGKILNMCAVEIPQLVGGTADLAGSTKGAIKGSPYIQRGNFSGRSIAFGVREHAMGAIGNGLALNKMLIPFTSTFFTFFDYMKPSVRLAALMKLPHLFIYSHDSIHVGEDGPTHQPIEHLSAIRVIPGIYTFRPGNDVEMAFSFLYFFQEMKGPAAIITSRQKLAKDVYSYQGNPGRETLYNRFKKGAYIFYETDSSTVPQLVLCGSGSELSTAMITAKMIEAKDAKRVRVISMPCLELFGETEGSYRQQLMPSSIPTVIIEAASHRSFNLFYHPNIMVVDIETFGISAPGNKVAEAFGITPATIYERIKKVIL